MPYLIVEHDHDPPATDADLEHMVSVLTPCLDVRNIRRLRTVMASDGRRGYCEFEAPDAETLREAYRSAQVKFRSVWSARIFDVQPPSEG